MEPRPPRQRCHPHQKAKRRHNALLGRAAILEISLPALLFRFATLFRIRNPHIGWLAIQQHFLTNPSYRLSTVVVKRNLVGKPILYLCHAQRLRSALETLAAKYPARRRYSASEVSQARECSDEALMKIITSRDRLLVYEIFGVKSTVERTSVDWIFTHENWDLFTHWLSGTGQNHTISNPAGWNWFRFALLPTVCASEGKGAAFSAVWIIPTF